MSPKLKSEGNTQLSQISLHKVKKYSGDNSTIILITFKDPQDI